MDTERASNDLQSLLQAIKTSDVVECRIQLINQLGDSDPSDPFELSSLVKCLEFWEDSTCLDVSQCILNKTILHVAARYLQKDISGCLTELLSLGIKANIWCAQHFRMPLVSTEESQEEHSSIFFQLVLDMLSFSAATISALVRSPALGHKVFMLTVEKFILEQFNLTKISISEIKNIQSTASEVLKLAQEVLIAVIRLCRVYSQSLISDRHGARTENGVSMDSEESDSLNHVINITTYTINNLYELGILAATGGGSLVTILNTSWKGVVSLLQLDNGNLAANVNVADIILKLISLATESLSCAAESWSSRLEEKIEFKEAKRTFFPVKFYLINAVRLLSQYPHQEFPIYREVSLLALKISAFGVSLSYDARFKGSSEAFTEFLEPTSSLLLHTLLNSGKVQEESKLQIIDWLFTDEDHLNPNCPMEIKRNQTSSMVEIFTFNCESMPRERTLILGRILLFLNLLRSSSDLGEGVRLGLSKKLAWIFYCIQDEKVYSSVLVLHTPVLYSLGSVPKLVWQPLFDTIVSALKTFMIVASSSSSWAVVETSLLENFSHPHFLIWEIVMELWCFFVRHAEIETLNDIIGKLCLIFKSMASFSPAVLPGSSIRKMARSICVLLTHIPQSALDQVYSSIITDGKSASTSIMHVILLVEGFPLNLLSNNLKNLAVQRITSAYCSFIEIDSVKLLLDSISSSCSSFVVGEPVYALSSVLRCIQIGSFDPDCKTLKFTLALINGCKSATDNSRDTCYELLGQTLAIISKTKHLYASSEMVEVIFKLRTLFDTGSESLNVQLCRCKPDLALFLGSLGYMKIIEVVGNSTTNSLWEMYYMLLRERHWAFVHLAITAFGYFAAHTTCSQLWRFLPPDAALSFDIETGTKIDEEKFMSELKPFLEKEVALIEQPEELALLVREGLILKETVREALSIETEPEPVADIMEIDEENQVSKKRKLPDEINQGMSLLQNGLKVMGDGLAQWQKEHSNSTELQKFSTHFSCLEDVISHLVSLAGCKE